MFDEMKIRSNLVFDKNTGKLTGFTDLEDSTINYATFEKQDALQSHVLAFFIRGLTTVLKFSFSYFGTKGVKQLKFYQHFGNHFLIYKKTCILWVIAATSDGHLQTEYCIECIKTWMVIASQMFVIEQ